MCFVLVGFKVKPGFPLVIAANRDEYFSRESVAAHWWPRNPPILAGRDVSAGGTWFGVREDGRFAVVTNRRVPPSARSAVASRGELVLRVLDHDGELKDFRASTNTHPDRYNSFNLLYGNTRELYYHDNFTHRAQVLREGIHALSNAFLDTPWPKTESGRKRFGEILKSDGNGFESIFDVLTDSTTFPDPLLPDTGLGKERERALSSIFINGKDYGTRCSTLFAINDAGDAHLEERNHAGLYTGRIRSIFSFSLDNSNSSR
jgi:uncharacterized protein with NRDE domain